jgi:hypothetical protein
MKDTSCIKMLINIKKYWVFFLILALSGVLNHEVLAQKRSKKGKNLVVSKYKGNIKSFTNKRYFSIGATINSLNYFGDLAPKPGWASTDLSFTRPGFGFIAEYRFYPRISFFGSLTMGTIKGDDYESADPNDSEAKYRYIRNLSFRNRIVELSVGGKVDLFSNKGTYLSRPILNPYIFGGIAVFHHNPQAIAPDKTYYSVQSEPIKEAGKWVDLQPLGTEGQYSGKYGVKPYKLIQISVPVGIGTTYRINNVLNIALEVGYRILFFDYIDDVSGNYVDLGALSSPLAKAMSDRSQEPVAVVSGSQRDFENVIKPNTSYYSYTSKYDGQKYTVFAGYGSEYPTNNRGGSKENDIYWVTSIKVTYIIGGTFRNAKFR